MGLIGLIIAVVVMVLGAGYFLFDAPQSAMTMTNDGFTAPIAAEISRGQSAIGAARDVKDLVEQRAAETMQEGEAPAASDSKPAGKEDFKANEATAAMEASEALSIADRLMSSGFTVKSSRTIDTVVLHSSYDLLGKDPYSVSGIVKEYEEYGVSAHYLIDRQGTIYRLVADNNIAYHAGVSKMPDGRTNVNDFSIGIEMMNTEAGQFTQAQYAAVNALISSLKRQYPIKSVVGHSDIAPDRKTDPWNFDWKRLQ